ncbi:Pentapeptide repeats (8 copies) [compost metagenome]
MNKTDVWGYFIENEVMPSRTKQLRELYQFYNLHKDEITKDIVKLIDIFCLEIQRQQAEGIMEKCVCIQFSLLRTTLMEGRPVYMLEANDQTSLNKVSISPYRYDAEWIFSFMNKWIMDLGEKRKVYMDQIKLFTFEAWVLEQIYPFHVFMVHAVRYAIDDIEQLQSFQGVAKEESFDIRVGEYKDKEMSESVYRRHDRHRSSITCKGWLENKFEKEYIYEHVAKADVSQGDYSDIHLLYTRFEEMNFSGSNFQNSLLLGSKFDRCICDYVDFSSSVAFDASFRDCNLRGARFDKIVGIRDVMNERRGTFFGIHGMRFNRANLQDASFRKAQISADFTYANLDGTDFTGAELIGSRMLQSDVFKVRLSEEQRRSVSWVEE